MRRKDSVHEKGMSKDATIGLLDLIMCLSDAMDFIDQRIVNHHKQVAFIACNIGLEIGLSPAEQRELALAGALHDIGAFSLKERKNTLTFEMESPHLHAETGAALLSLFDPISNIAPIVRFHHLPWDQGRGADSIAQQVPEASHILHLADRVAVLINKNTEVLGQAPSICGKIREKTGGMFKPRVVDAFLEIASREYFWLDAVSPLVQSTLSRTLKDSRIGLSSESMLGFSKLFSRIIDFKSPFTAKHSSGVAASAELLAKLIGFKAKECRYMRIAGYLHDLGKLAVPVEILDKPKGLDRREFNVIRHHTFYTYRLLETLRPLAVINKWASFHHERLDGSGYPFHLKKKDLPLGSQIMAVADVFTAITERRPYRAEMPKEHAVRVLDDMAGNSALNKEIVATLIAHYEEIDAARVYAQASAARDYGTVAAHQAGNGNFRQL